MPGNFATTWNPIFKPPPCFSQDFLNTPRIHLQNSKSEQAKKVYAMCIAEWPKLWRRYIPMYPGLMTKKIIFLGEIHKDPHKKCLHKFVCKWISLLIPRSLNYKLTVNLKNFTNFHESYKSVTNLFFWKKRFTTLFVKIRECWIKMFSLGRCVQIQRWNWKSSLCVGLD